MSTWLSLGNPQLAEFKDRSQEMVTRMKKELGRSTRRSRRTVMLEDKWTDADSNEFRLFKQRVLDSAKLALETYDESKNLVLVTDASEFYWAAILGQETGSNDAQCFVKLIFQLLFFACGKFKGSANV